MKDIAKFFIELGQLKRVKRSGWWTVGIKDPESVADHSFRAAMIGYILAKLENQNTNNEQDTNNKINAEKVALMCLFQDIPETRLNDLHKTGQRYINFKEAEKKSWVEQVASLTELNKETKDDMLKSFDEYHSDKSKEGIIARDADLLECAIQAKEYLDIGHKDCQNWIDNVTNLLKTESAKKVLDIIKNEEHDSWYMSLKKVER